MKHTLALLLLVALGGYTTVSTTVSAQEGDIRLKVNSTDLAEPTRETAKSSATFVQPGPAVGPTAARPLAHRALSAPIDSVVGVRGIEKNTVFGRGIVTGLSGTGDSSDLVKRFLANDLLKMGSNVELGLISSKNLAVVSVQAEIPYGAKPGRAVDVRISTIGDCTSLVGGVLEMTELMDARYGSVYVTASGPVTVGGFLAAGETSSAQKNITTVGLLSGGGKVQREVPTSIINEHGYIHLDAKKGQGSFGNMVAVAEAVNRLYPDVAEVTLDGSTVKVAIPSDLPKNAYVRYLHSILRQEISTENKPRIVVNERTGVIVIGGDVRLRAGTVAHGGITVTVADSPQVSQPGGLSGGQTEVVPSTNLVVEEEGGTLIPIPEAGSLQEVVDVLNVLGATPRDLISILTALSDAGLLVGEIRRL